MTQYGDEDETLVLRVLARGRANTHHICQQSGLDDAAATQVLAQLSAADLITEVDRGLYAITAAGLERLDRDYPAEAGFLHAAEVIHDAPSIKTVRLRGDRGLVEVQIDEESVTTLAGALQEVVADTHSDHEILRALHTFVDNGREGQ
jgi:hypothetical protein